MTIKKALEHFEWKFTNKWNPTPTDITAYNTLVDFVEQKHKEQLRNNELFAKLYITFFGELLRYYECTVMDNEPQKAIHKILDTPIEVLIDKFIDKQQTIEYALQIPKKDRYKHPKQIDKYELKEVVKMEYKETKDNLVSLINLALNEYSK